MCLLLTSPSFSGTSHKWMEQARLKSKKPKGKAPEKLTSPECPLYSKFCLKLLGEEVEDTVKAGERQSQSKCQCQFLPLEPEGCDTILHNLENTGFSLVYRQRWSKALHRSNKHPLKSECLRGGKRPLHIPSGGITCQLHSPF